MPVAEAPIGRGPSQDYDAILVRIKKGFANRNWNGYKRIALIPKRTWFGVAWRSEYYQNFVLG